MQINLLELILLIAAAAFGLKWFFTSRSLKQQQRDNQQLLDYHILQIEKNRAKLRQEYLETGWSPYADKLKKSNSDSGNSAPASDSVEPTLH